MTPRRRPRPEAIDALNKISLAIEKMESRSEAIGPMLDTLAPFRGVRHGRAPTRRNAR